MIRYLMTAIIVGGFISIGIFSQAMVGQTLAQTTQRCVSVPKTYIPCPYAAQTYQPQTKYMAQGPKAPQKKK